MNFLDEIARFIHIAFGAIGLAAFWIPIFARKGAVNHVRFGRIFVRSAYVVLGTAAVALAMRLAGLLAGDIGIEDNPLLYAFIVFLAYLTLVTFVTVRHGMSVLRHKKDPASLDTPLNFVLACAALLASACLIAYALILSPPIKILLLALSPIGISIGYGNIRYMKSPAPSSRGWMYEHLGAMLGSGIAFHTAFAVFGSTRLFDIGLTGWVAVIPWIAPAAIGIPAIMLWTRYYRHKFGEPA